MDVCWKMIIIIIITNVDREGWLVVLEYSNLRRGKNWNLLLTFIGSQQSALHLHIHITQLSNSEERLVNLDRGIECFVGLSILLVIAYPALPPPCLWSPSPARPTARQWPGGSRGTRRSSSCSSSGPVKQ